MTELLGERLQALLAAGAAEHSGDQDFVELFALDGGERYGLVVAGQWAVMATSGLTVLSEATATAFVQLLECSRDEIELQIAKGAEARGLPLESVMRSLPAIELVRAILDRRSQHYCRLALGWLRATELRPLRAEIAALAADGEAPEQLRALARRLTVPLSGA